MAKLISLRSGFKDSLSDYYTDFSSLRDYSIFLKQQALLFDQIGILNLSQLKAITEFYGTSAFLRNFLPALNLELYWLEENGVIFELSDKKEIIRSSEYYFDQFPSPRTHIENEFLEFFNKLVNTSQLDEHTFRNFSDYKNVIFDIEEFIIRKTALETEKKMESMIAIPYTKYRGKLRRTLRNDTIQVIINNLPLPNNQTPWEQIIEYRSDSGNQKNLINLRRWIRKVSLENISPVEIEEEIEWLMNEFQNHMKLHKMKANTEKLEVIVKTPLEIIENIFKLQFSKTFEPFFTLKKIQINLLESEMNAPGREMAYIINARDTFQSDE